MSAPLEAFEPKSTWVKRVSFHPNSQTIRITFHRGGKPYGTWIYAGTKKDYDAFKAAASKGRFARRFIGTHATK